MGFAKIIGHTKQLESIRAALANRRLHHAYLFVGPEGVGKRTVAMALAKAIYCAEQAGDYCDHCVACESIIDKNHPDVRYVQALPGKKEISIQQVREIERELRFRSFSGKQKVAIIDPAGLMNVAAQNALLKTLEEPPDNSLIILVSPNGGSLLPTLRSRCLRVTFAPVPRAQVVAFLREEQKLEAEHARVVAAMSMGSIGKAVNPDQQALFDKRRNWSGILGQLKRGGYQQAMEAAEALAASREETLEFLNWAESWYRDLLIHYVTGETEEFVNLDMVRQIEERSSDASFAQAVEASDRIAVAVAGIQRNLNRRMTLEKLFFDLIEER